MNNLFDVKFKRVGRKTFQNKKILKSISFGLIIFTLSSLWVSPAQAFDDSAPTIGSISVTPPSVDVTNSAADLTFTFSGADETAVRDAAFICYTSNNIRSVDVGIRPGNSRETTQVTGSSEMNPRILSYTGDPTNFTIQFVVTVAQGLFPGRNGCYTDIYDTVSHWKGYYDIAIFHTIRAGLGYPVSTPSPTPTLTPTPTPTPKVEFEPTLAFLWKGESMTVTVSTPSRQRGIIQIVVGTKAIPSKYLNGTTVVLSSRKVSPNVNGEVRLGSISEPFKLQTTFTSCTAMRNVFYGGVASSAKRKNIGKALKHKFTVFPAAYSSSKKLDTDKDGIACER